MKRVKRCIASIILAGVLVVTPAAELIGQSCALTVSAHGHHGGGHHGEGYRGGNNASDVTYYYCGGHDAHCHENGVCPYDTVSGSDGDVTYYYCGGHDAHCHENGVCPYEAVPGSGAGAAYYYCGGHGAHCHEDGICPYAEAAGSVLGGNGAGASGSITGTGWMKRCSAKAIRCRNIYVRRTGLV